MTYGHSANYKMETQTLSTSAHQGSAMAVRSGPWLGLCCLCGAGITRQKAPPACHVRRLSCTACKKSSAREIKRRWKQSDKGQAARCRENEKRSQQHREMAQENSKCATCGCGLPPPDKLQGWTQRKCTSCSDAAPSRQPEAKRKRLRDSYHRNPGRWKERHAQWVIANEKWVREYNSYWARTKKKHSLSYAAQLLRRGTRLSHRDIPRALREVKLIEIQIKRMLNEKRN